jgi:hypothetical protein
MTSTATRTKQPERTHEDRMKVIEHDHFGRCLWQQLLEGRRIMVELMDFPKAKTTAVVIKHYDDPIPRATSGKPWPKVIASYVYLPVDDSNTWDGLDAALTARHK